MTPEDEMRRRMGVPVSPMFAGPQQPMQGPPVPADPRIPAQPGAANPYANQPVIDPNRAMWGGILSDIGTFIGSAGRTPMRGLGFQLRDRALARNMNRARYIDEWQRQQSAERRADAAASREEERLGLAKSRDQRAAEQFEYEQEQDRLAREAAAATAQREQARWIQEGWQPVTTTDPVSGAGTTQWMNPRLFGARMFASPDEAKAQGAGAASPGAGTGATPPAGAAPGASPMSGFQGGPGIGPVISQTLPRWEQEAIANAESRFAEQNQAYETSAAEAESTRDVLYTVSRDLAGEADLNLGGGGERIQRFLTGTIGPETETSVRTARLQEQAQLAGLGATALLKGAISEKELDIAMGTRPQVSDSEQDWFDYYLRTELARQAAEEMLLEKRKHVAAGKRLDKFNDERVWREIYRDKRRNLQSLKKSLTAKGVTRDSFDTLLTTLGQPEGW